MRAEKAKSGFTLIELLVVVAIIALLIAILLPSLGKARFRARVTACAANMKQVGTAIGVYANEWTDHIPTAFRHDPPNIAKAHYYPFEAWLLGGANPGDPIYSTGLLYAPKGGAIASLTSGTIADPRILFCPAQTDTGFIWYGNDKTGNWLANTAGNATTGNPHMGYQYDLHVTTTANSNGQFEIPFNTLSRFPKNMSVLVDLINNTSTIAHANSPSVGTWNLLFADGHVDPAKSSRLVKWLSTNSSMITTEAASAWTSFRPEMDDLERLSGN